MARARNIKPGFFLNDKLAECDISTRLLFIGLWCIADREGRLKDRPKRIKAEVFPYDDIDVEPLLGQLQENGFIIRYSVDEHEYIQVVNFNKHQNPHVKEAESTLPPCPDYEQAPEKHHACTIQAPDLHSSFPADSLIPDSLIPDSGFSDSLQDHAHVEPVKKNKPAQAEKAKIMSKEIQRLFDSKFWPMYPRKVAKKEAFNAFKKHFPTSLSCDECNVIFQNMGRYLANLLAEKRPADKIPYPATFLNREDFSVEPEPIDTGEYEFVEVAE